MSEEVENSPGPQFNVVESNDAASPVAETHSQQQIEKNSAEIEQEGIQEEIKIEEPAEVAEREEGKKQENVEQERVSST